MSRDPKSVLGIDWGSARTGTLQGFGGVHLFGKALLTAFGFSGTATALEKIESPILPTWAGGTWNGKLDNGGQPAKTTPGQSAQPDYVVTTPDYVVIVYSDKHKPEVIAIASAVGVFGGRKFPGNGYQHGEVLGNRFSFGYDKPSRVDVVMQNRATTSYSNIKQVLLCGGLEDAPRAGFQKETAAMDNTKVIGAQILRELADSEDLNTEDLIGYTAGEFQVGDCNPYLVGADVIGAAMVRPMRQSSGPLTPVRAGFVIKSSDKGRQYTSLALNPSRAARPADHKASIQNAKDAGKRAVTIGQKLLKLTAKKAIIGATAMMQGQRPKGQALTAVKLQQLAKKVIDAGNASLKGADKHKTLVSKYDAAVKAGASRGKAATHIHGVDTGTEIVGDEFEIIGEFYDIVAADPPPIPDPLHPGFLTDNSPDPNYQGGGDGGAPADSGGGSTGTPAALSSDPTFGLGPPPTAPPPLVAGQDYVPDPGSATDTNWYSSDTVAPGVPIPDGAIYYDATQKIPFAGVASMSRIVGQVPGLDYPEGGYSSGFELHDDGWYWWWRDAYNDGVAVDLRWKRFGDMNAQEMQKESIQHKWGPLMGDPNKGWPAGLRLDVAKGQWFWYRDKAPSWATAADDMARFNKAVLDYKAAIAAAAADAASHAAQDRLDADNAAKLAKQQALEDAATARQQQQQQATADQTAALAAQQLQTQQAAADQRASEQAASQQAQEAQFDLQTRQADLSYAQQHPEVMRPEAQVPPEGPAPMDAGAPEGPDANVDWGNQDGATSGTRGMEDRSSDQYLDTPEEG